MFKWTSVYRYTYQRLRDHGYSMYSVYQVWLQNNRKCAIGKQQPLCSRFAQDIARLFWSQLLPDRHSCASFTRVVWRVRLQRLWNHGEICFFKFVYFVYSGIPNDQFVRWLVFFVRFVVRSQLDFPDFSALPLGGGSYYIYL